ncbi:MAG: FAD-binding oxidoreductase [Acidobacteriota bacterium]|nr:FAD-binding oxidoreductase [Acidobacteriota bacterium]
MRQASSAAIPVTIAGAGTGLTGGRVAQGGWVVSLEKFTRLEIHERSATAGAGVLLKDLHAAAARMGLFYPPDPTETWASIGGTIANNASGSRSFRHGDTSRHVLRLRVVLIDGRVIEAARGDRIDFDVPAAPLPRTTKHTAGYRLQPGMDWIDLFTGSEGTLGVVIEAELQLLPAPATLLAGVIFFREDERSLAAVKAWRSIAGLRMIEYFDGPSLALLRDRYPEVPAEAGAALLFEQEGDADLEIWPDRLEDAGALIEASWFALGVADRERFRQFRHALPELVNGIVRRNGCLKMGSDYAVPLDRNEEMLAYYRRGLEAEFPGQYVIFGHIGDAHVHVNILPRNDTENDEESARAKDLMLDFAREAVALGGTVSAEHGLGKRKSHLLELQYSPEQIEAMRQVKRRLDPQWLLGRGNLFPG